MNNYPLLNAAFIAVLFVEHGHEPVSLSLTLALNRAAINRPFAANTMPQAVNASCHAKVAEMWQEATSKLQ